MNKKYELLKDDTKTHCGITLYRIKSLVAIGLYVSVGDLGGYVQSEKNLDCAGDAWVSGNARVSGNAWVSGNARVYGNAQVYGNAWVYGNARVYGNALIITYTDIQVFQGVGSENGTLTAYITKEKTIEITRGCFIGSLQEFRDAVNNKHGADSKIGWSYLGIANLIEHWFSDAPEKGVQSVSVAAQLIEREE